MRFLLLTVLLISLLPPGVAQEEVPPAPELKVAEIAHRTLERLRNRELYFRGKRIFARQCVHCHGARGQGDGQWAATMTNKPRNLRSGIFKFRTTPCGKLPTDADLRRTIRTGISGTAMPTFSKMSAAELDAVVAYVQSLSRRWKDEKSYALPLTLPPPPAWLNNEEQSQSHIAKARVLFTQLCSSCHGEKGKGDGRAAAGLIDAWKHPIVPADLAQPHHKSGDRPIDLFRTIAAGLDGTPMVGFHESLTEEQIWQLVAYIVSLSRNSE